MGLYRHSRTLLVAATDVDLVSQTMRFRPLDGEREDAQVDVLLWSELEVDVGDTKAKPSPTLTVELSPDGRSWVRHYQLSPKGRPTLDRISHMLPFIRVVLRPAKALVTARVLLLASAPFELRAERRVQVSVGAR